MHEKATTAVLVALVCCAVITTGTTVRNAFEPRERSGAGLSRQPDAEIENWETYLDGGHRIGPADAKLVILEFGDFECPSCRSFARRTMRGVLASYPDQVALVYRHFPLAYHRFAFTAAHASECAATQQRFEAMHDVLFQKQDSLGVKSFVSYAVDAGVADTAEFTRCMNRAAAPELSSIASDSAAARNIGSRGTPTIIIGGTRLGSSPDSARLDSLIRVQLTRLSRMKDY